MMVMVMVVMVMVAVKLAAIEFPGYMLRIHVVVCNGLHIMYSARRSGVLVYSDSDLFNVYV